MYYSNGNYEAFARPVKPQDVEKKSAYIVGSGLAGLSAAAFLVRDAQMPGKQIHIFEELPLDGGALDGYLDPARGFVMRGGREMENHYECLWDLFRSVPSIENENASVLDEFYWLNKKDPNYSKCRVIHNRGENAHTENKFTLSDKAMEELVHLFLASEESLENKRIDEVFTDEVFESNFWIYWTTMFAFEKWHSAMEMRRYMLRFIHHLGGLPDLSALKFTKYNQYESLVLPLVRYLKDHGVQFENGVTVKNVEMEHHGNEKLAKTILLERNGKEERISLTSNDLVFVTNGSITESSTYGDQTHPAPVTHELGGSWTLWENLAAQDDSFGNPKVFYKDLPKESWFVSATVTTLDDKVAPYIEKISQRDPYAGNVVTGGIVTVKDSSWIMSYTLNRQPQFKCQPKDQLAVWVYGLLSNKSGDYIKKNIEDCSGEEICQEWLYHLGVPTDQIPDLAKNSCKTVPVYMPYITSYFMPRKMGDRPLVVPKGSVNLAFIGNFAETPRDTLFTTEYSVRTAMEAVYTLLSVDRGVPEVWASAYDIREILKSVYLMTDGKTLPEIKVPWLVKAFEKRALEKAKGTYLEELLKEAHLL